MDNILESYLQKIQEDLGSIAQTQMIAGAGLSLAGATSGQKKIGQTLFISGASLFLADEIIKFFIKKYECFNKSGNNKIKCKINAINKTIQSIQKIKCKTDKCRQKNKASIIKLQERISKIKQ